MQASPGSSRIARSAKVPTATTVEERHILINNPATFRLRANTAMVLRKPAIKVIWKKEKKLEEGT